MTTKEQERAALAKIKKIVEGLGENSYIGMAFEGCFEDAEDNIDNEFGNSWKSRAEYAQREADRLRKKVDEAYKKYADKANEFGLVTDTMRQEADRANSLAEKYSEANKVATENWNKFREMEDKASALELENMKLKAKLYDMMVGA